ncbi:hypothetical protein Tco_1047481 [Tanacetum coccineum]
MREMEFTLLVMGDLDSSLISTFSGALLVCVLPCSPVLKPRMWFLMLVAEGLDRYVHERRRGSALAVHFGFVDESSNRLLRYKLEGCALRCRNSLDWFGESFCVIPALMVVESEVLNDFPRFVGILIEEFAAGGAVNLAFNMKGDMIIKKLDYKPTIDAMMRDFLHFAVLPSGKN